MYSMSKDEVWKIIFFFNANKPKIFFPDCVGTLR